MLRIENLVIRSARRAAEQKSGKAQFSGEQDELKNAITPHSSHCMHSEKIDYYVVGLSLEVQIYIYVQELGW